MDGLQNFRRRQGFTRRFKYHISAIDRQDLVEKPFAGHVGCRAFDLDIVTDLEFGTPGAVIGAMHRIAARHEVNRGRNSDAGQEVHILTFGSGKQHAFVVGQGGVHVDQNLPPGRADVITDRKDQIVCYDIGILDRRRGVGHGLQKAHAEAIEQLIRRPDLDGSLNAGNFVGVERHHIGCIIHYGCSVIFCMKRPKLLGARHFQRRDRISGRVQRRGFLTVRRYGPQNTIGQRGLGIGLKQGRFFLGVQHHDRAAVFDYCFKILAL